MESELVGLVRSFAMDNQFLAYIFFFFNSVVQIMFPPYPGDSIIIFGGYLCSKGVLNTAMLLTNVITATFLSSSFLYFISYKYSEKIISNRFISKYFDIKKISKMEGWFNRYGAAAIIINKFIPGVSSLTMVAAGIFKLKPYSAFVAIGAATVLHNFILFFSGKLAGDNMEMIKGMISEYNRLLVLGLLIILGIYIYIKLFGKKNNKVF